MPADARPASRGQNNGRPGSAGGGVEKSLRETVRQVLLSDVVRMDGGSNGGARSGGSGGGGGGDAWRVMVLDARATRVISSVVGMYDIMEGHVTVVEDLHKVCGAIVCVWVWGGGGGDEKRRICWTGCWLIVLRTTV